MVLRHLCRLTAAPLRPLARNYHADASVTQRGISEIFSDMISSGPQPSMERINTFMNAVYFHKPRVVTPVNINYRSPSERSTIKGLRIGTNHNRQPHPMKNVILVSGLPLQDPSVINVNLYVAAMLSCINPMLPYDVSVIPLAHPKEYEKHWRKAELVPPNARELLLSASSAPSTSHNDPSKWITPENVSLELRDACKPLEVYITRRNKYYVNLDVDLTTPGATPTYKSDSLSHLFSLGKFGRFFSHPQSRLPPTPTHPHAHQTPSAFPTFPTQHVRGGDSLMGPLLDAPSLVLELRCSKALDDDQVVARGEEVIAIVKELLA